MGLTSSPRIFTKVLKPVFASLRTKFGHTCLGYIDADNCTKMMQIETMHLIGLSVADIFEKKI